MITPWKLWTGLAVLLALGAPPALGMPLFSATQTRLGFLNPPLSGMSFTLTFTDLPTQPGAPGRLTVTAFGDFDDANETLTIVADGVFDFGPFLNGQPDDDLFDNQLFNDRGREYALARSAGAVIPLADLQGLVADGRVEFRVGWSSQVSNLFNNPDEFVTLAFEYRFIEPVLLTVPASAGLLAVGLAGLGWRRRRD